MYIREEMFRLFTARIKAMFDKCHLILENKCFVFLRRALKQSLSTTLSNIREQMFRLLIARIKAMFDHNIISIREEMFSIFKRG